MNDRIEERLRTDLRLEAEGVRLSSDPWQENQRRVTAASSGRSRRVLTLAAVVLAVATLVGGITLLGGRGSEGAPASGTGDPFTAKYLLGPPVEAETLTIDGRQTVHTIALSDMTGEGPNLCDQYEQVVADGADTPDSSSGSGGCTPRDPSADDETVSFDWLMGTEGSGNIRGVTAGVDERVSFVQIWMSNGDRVPADLRPSGWDGTALFALTLPSTGPVPQRLVATGRDGNVLQAIELTSRFGRSWLAQRSACAGDRVAELVPNGDVLPNAYVALGTVDASISVRTALDDGGTACLEQLRPDALAGWYPGGLGLVAAVLAPEVTMVRLVVGETVVDEVKPSSVSGSPWRVAILKAADVAQLDRAELVALDAHSLELDRQRAGQLGSATP